MVGFDGDKIFVNQIGVNKRKWGDENGNEPLNNIGDKLQIESSTKKSNRHNDHPNNDIEKVDNNADDQETSKNIPPATGNQGFTFD